MTIEVLGDMPKVIGFEQETVIQVLIFNFSFVNLLLYYYFTYILVKNSNIKVDLR